MKSLATFLMFLFGFILSYSQNSLIITVKDQANQNVSGAELYVFGTNNNQVFDSMLSETSAGVYQGTIPDQSSNLAVYVFANDYQSNTYFLDNFDTTIIIYPPDLQGTPKVFISPYEPFSTTQYIYVPNFNSYSSVSINYGDGTTETLSNQYATHQYPNYGIYDVLVQATDNSGNLSQYSSLVVIAPQTPDTNAFADFVYGYDSTENIYHFSDLSYVQSGQISSGSWDFGDGNTYNDLYAEHQYAQPGIYTVTHYITDSLGNTLSASKRIIVPDSNISISNIYWVPEINFLSNNKFKISSNFMETDGSYLITNYWISEDGKISNRTYEYFQVPDDGIYAVKYGVNTTKHDLKNIYYTYIAPENNNFDNPVDFAPFIPQGSKGITVGFINLSRTTGEFIWDFGDAKKLYSKKTKNTDLDIVYHTYSEAGTYVVKLTNTSNNASFISKIKVAPQFVSPIYSIQPGKVSATIIENESSDLLIGLYPNPAKDFIKIITSETCPKTIQLYSIDGKIIKTITSEQKNIFIDISYLPSGVYILKINAKGSSVSQKIIKN